MKTRVLVTLAKAGVHGGHGKQWIPAFAGMTEFSRQPQATRNLALL